MNSMLLIGAMLLSALLAAKLVGVLGAPKVTGYLAAGLLLGPAGLGLVSHEQTTSLSLLSQLAIALILFDIGGEFDPATVRLHGASGIRIACLESLITVTVVAAALALAGASAIMVVLLACIAVETSPSATILVIKEFQARGPVTSTLLVAVSVNILIATGLFHFALVAVGAAPWLFPIQALGGALVLGMIGGWLLGRLGTILKKDTDLLVLAMGLLLLMRGTASSLHLSGMLATMIAGTVAASFPRVRSRIFDLLKPIAWILYAVFFVVAGASLHLDLLGTVGKVGLAYLGGRLIGKLLGGWIAGRRYLGQSPRPYSFSLGLVPHAGVAIGLVSILERHLPDLFPTIQVIGKRSASPSGFRRTGFGIVGGLIWRSRRPTVAVVLEDSQRQSLVT